MRPVQLLLVVVACGGTSSPSAPPPGARGAMAGPRPLDAGGAVAAFRAQWDERVLPGLTAEQRATLSYIDGRMRAEPELLKARVEPCRERHALIAEINRSTGYDFVVYGRLADLDRDGRCWAVMFHGGMKGEVEGYFPADGDDLLLVWRIPEG